MSRRHRRSHRDRGRQNGKTPSKQSKTRGRSKKSRELSPRELSQRERSFDALNLYRSAKAKSPSSAARMAGTTIRAMRESVPAAFLPNRRGRVRIKASDRYSAKVQIVTREGAVATTARGSRERALAGQHRASVFSVLAGLQPPSALRKYRGKKIGGHRLVSDYKQLLSLANAGVIGHLETLYVSPAVGA